MVSYCVSNACCFAPDSTSSSKIPIVFFNLAIASSLHVRILVVLAVPVNLNASVLHVSREVAMSFAAACSFFALYATLSRVMPVASA